MIIADENIDNRIIDAIRNLGIEVYSVSLNNKGISDYQIIEISKKPPRIILSRDKDFGEWVFVNNVKGISVLFLRYKFAETEQIIEIIKNLLTNHLKELFNSFTTVTTQKIRSRKI
jgi:predicted nuclease of predicted toxin-antitoxin system